MPTSTHIGAAIRSPLVYAEIVLCRRGMRIATGCALAMTHVIRLSGETMYYYVYILANRTNTTIYTGVTNDLYRRLEEHRIHADPQSFTARYDVTKLVYFEQTTDIYSALEREKQIKGWSRKKKNLLVESRNPKWEDLLPQLLDSSD